MLSIVSRVPDAPETVVESLPPAKKVRFRRLAQEVTFSSNAANAVIVMQPIYDYEGPTHRRSVKVITFEESQELVKYISDQKGS